MTTRGFTLIESLLYIAIFGIIMSGALSGIWAFIESADRSQTQALLETEGDFLVQKMEYDINHSKSISEPANNPVQDGTMSNELVLTSTDGTHIEIYLADSVLMRTENYLSLPLSSDSADVRDLLFKSTSSENGSLESLQTSFEISATTSDGQMLSQNFSTTNYISP